MPGSTITFATPINLTKETGDSAVFPWIVAGDAGQVDLVFYKANTGLNSDVAFVDQNGQPCPTDVTGNPTCTNPSPNTSVWNVYFSQSQNALNTGPNFKTVQISAQPNHVGQVCTFGLACTVSGNRNLLDFFTVDIDHLGAANVVRADDNNSRNDAINRFSRQISGNSVFKNTTIGLASKWPITDHAVTDPSGDVFGATGLPKSKTACPGMDVLATSEKQSGGILTVTLTLNNAPTAMEATTCSPEGGTTGGIWGTEFWSSTSQGGSENFYVAYRDNPPDGVPGGEAGRASAACSTPIEADQVTTPLTRLNISALREGTLLSLSAHSFSASSRKAPITKQAASQSSS